MNNKSKLNLIVSILQDSRHLIEHFDARHTMIRKAVCMSLINIGELTKSLSTSFKNENKAIPWKNISGLRDVTAHKYHTLNLDIIWSVVSIEIPKLKAFIDEYLNNF